MSTAVCPLSADYFPVANPGCPIARPPVAPSPAPGFQKSSSKAFFSMLLHAFHLKIKHIVPKPAPHVVSGILCMIFKSKSCNRAK